MTMAQVNVRIDAELKHAVEAELGRLGSSPTVLIRDVYRYVAAAQRLPDLRLDGDGGVTERERRRRLTAIELSHGIVGRVLSEVGLDGSMQGALQSCTHRQLHDVLADDHLAGYLRRERA